MGNLKACPHCGHKAIPLQIITPQLCGFSVMCQNCGTAIFEFNLETGTPNLWPSLTGATEKWNRRPGVLDRIRTPEDRREPFQTREG